jgi:hypothetical protein
MTFKEFNPGNLLSGHQGNHIPFMLVPKNYW